MSQSTLKKRFFLWYSGFFPEKEDFKPCISHPQKKTITIGSQQLRGEIYHNFFDCGDVK